MLAERLILCIFGYGTNIGLRAIAAGEHGHTEDDLRYVGRRFLSAEVPAGSPPRSPTRRSPPAGKSIWGAGTGAVASDSTHFGAFDQNLFTQHHSATAAGVC